MTLSSQLKNLHKYYKSSEENGKTWQDDLSGNILNNYLFQTKTNGGPIFEKFLVDNRIKNGNNPRNKNMDYLFFKVIEDMKEKAAYIYANKEIVYDKFRKRSVNNSLSEKYDEKGNYWNNFNNFFSLIYNLLFLAILIITFWKKQYKNYKIFVYLLAFFLLSYSIFPIYEKINDYFYNTNRMVQLILSYSFLAFVFLLLNSFTNYVFDVENTEGKRDMFILYGVFGVTAIIVFFRYMVYNYGFKDFVSP
tara:strand:- start:242 stop:988 length:747 start_codon:yes stop_codon:yes gene_type:complete